MSDLANGPLDLPNGISNNIMEDMWLLANIKATSTHDSLDFGLVFDEILLISV